ncbi:Zinc finger MYM-type protein 1-like, partial [Oopsacas minuta]
RFWPGQCEISAVYVGVQQLEERRLEVFPAQLFGDTKARSDGLDAVETGPHKECHRLMSDQNESIYKENSHYIGAVVDVVSLCCKQAIALLGHRKSDKEPSHVNKGKFLEVLDLVARHDPIVDRKLQEGPQNAKYTYNSI